MCIQTHKHIYTDIHTYIRYVCVYICVKICLYMSVSPYVLYVYVCVCVLFQGNMHSDSTRILWSMKFYSEHIHENTLVISTRSSYRTLSARQPALLETAATIYQTCSQLPTKIICHIVTPITIDSYDLFLNRVYVRTLLCLSSFTQHFVVRFIHFVVCREICCMVCSFSSLYSFPLYCTWQL